MLAAVKSRVWVMVMTALAAVAVIAAIANVAARIDFFTLYTFIYAILVDGRNATTSLGRNAKAPH